VLEPYGELKRKKRPAEAVAALEEQFPGFAVHLIPGHHGEERFEAVRRGGSDGDGLYAVISADPAEVARELTHAE
jgi:hypothetical protein